MRFINLLSVVAILGGTGLAQQTISPTAGPAKTFDPAQMPERFSEALKLQAKQRIEVLERLRSQGATPVPDMNFVMKDGAIYSLSGNTLIPLVGGGASGCLGSGEPKNLTPLGQIIFINPQPPLPYTFPAKDERRKN